MHGFLGVFVFLCVLILFLGRTIAFVLALALGLAIAVRLALDIGLSIAFGPDLPAACALAIAMGHTDRVAMMYALDAAIIICVIGRTCTFRRCSA